MSENADKQSIIQREIDTLNTYQLKEESKIQLVFVPESIADDLKAQNIPITDILYYDKAAAALGSNALKQLCQLNSLSVHTRVSLNWEETLDLVPMSEKLAPMLGEALDIRQLWLKSNLHQADAIYGRYFASEVPGAEYTIDQQTYEIYKLVDQTVKGIHATAALTNNMYERTHVSDCGRYYFIIMPLSTVESEPNELAVANYTKEAFKAVLRKAAIYHSEQIIVKTDLFSAYLVYNYHTNKS